VVAQGVELFFRYRNHRENIEVAHFTSPALVLILPYLERGSSVSVQVRIDSDGEIRKSHLMPHATSY
jgi:hypothetical protein